MATVKFYLKKPKQQTGKLRVDEVSIIAKFSIGRKGRFEITTGEKIIPSNWDKERQQVKSTYRGHFEINTFLQEFKTNLLKLYRDNPKIDFHKFKALAQQKPSQEKKTLFIALEQFLKQYQSEKDSKTLGKYAVMAKQLREYDKIHDIDFHNLDFRFYDGFKRFLFEIPNPNYKHYCLTPDSSNGGDYSLIPISSIPASNSSRLTVGLFDDTVYKYFINLKTFLAWSEKRGHQVHSSYKEWEIITRRYPPISLTLAELEKLESFEFTVENVKPFCSKGAEAGKVARACDIARDYLIFECRTGQRISDIKRFNLRDYSDFKWTFTPKKGNRISRKTNTVHFKGFCAPALLILEKHNWKMPEVSEQKINDNIKTACKIAGIDQEIVTYRWAQNKRIKIVGPKYEFLSSHIGRKSFITIALQFMPHKLVMTLAGIDSYATLKHYEGNSEDATIEQALEKIPTTRTLLRKAE